MYSAFYWEEKNALEEISTSSIVMQQTRTAGKRVNLYVLAVSGKKGKEGVREAGEFTHGMVQWFHRDFLMKMDRGRKGKQLRNNAWKIIYERAEKLALNKKELSFGYILLIENHIYLHLRGEVKLYFINKKYTRGLISEIKEDVAGTIQRGAGLYLTCNTAVMARDKQEICDSLLLLQNKNEQNMKNRLKELEEGSGRKEGINRGGIYLIYD